MSALVAARTLLLQVKCHEPGAVMVTIDTQVQVATIPCFPRQGELKVLGMVARNFSLPASATMALNYVRNHVAEISACLGSSPGVDPKNLVRLDRKGLDIREGHVDVVVYFPCRTCMTALCTAPLVLALCSVFWRLSLPEDTASMGAMDLSGKLYPNSDNTLLYFLIARTENINRFLMPHRNWEQLRDMLDEERPINYKICRKQFEMGFRGFKNLLDMIGFAFGVTS